MNPDRPNPGAAERPRNGPLPLFREEAIRHQRERAWGELFVRPPRWVRLAVWLLLAWVAAAVAFVVTAEYTRKTRAPVVLAHAVAPAVVAAIEPGVLLELAVVPGQRVAPGDLLARISTERTVAGEALSTGALADEAERQRALAAERQSAMALADAQTRQANARLAALAQEIAQQEREIAAQQARLTALETQVARFRELSRDRFVSELQLQQKADEASEQAVKLESLRRALSGLARERAALEADLPAIEAARRARLAAIDRELASASGERRRVAARGSYELRATAPGQVGRVIASVGHTVAAGEPVLTIEPPTGGLFADIYVSTRNAGFVQIGQPVRLAIDAFPFERFGHVEATVVEVGSAVITPREAEAMRLPITLAEPSFRLRARLDRTSVAAYGRTFPLQAGLVGRADLLLDRRPLAALLIDPVLRLRGSL